MKRRMIASILAVFSAITFTVNAAGAPYPPYPQYDENGVIVAQTRFNHIYAVWAAMDSVGAEANYTIYEKGFTGKLTLTIQKKGSDGKWTDSKSWSDTFSNYGDNTLGVEHDLPSGTYRAKAYVVLKDSSGNEVDEGFSYSSERTF